MNKSRRSPDERMEDLKKVDFILLSDSFDIGIYLCIKCMIFTRLSSLQAIRSHDYGSHTMLRDSGISITTQFTQVKGRILPAPIVNRNFLYLLSISFTLSHPPSFMTPSLLLSHCS